MRNVEVEIILCLGMKVKCQYVKSCNLMVRKGIIKYCNLEKYLNSPRIDFILYDIENRR